MHAPSPKTVGELLALLFPERRLSLHTGSGDHDYVLTSPRQAAICLAVVAVLLWMNLSLVSLVIGAMGHSADDQAAHLARLTAPDHAVLAAGDDVNGLAPTDTPAELATKVERRHAALSMLLNEAHNDSGAAEELQPAFPALLSDDSSPTTRIIAVAQDQDRLVAAVAAFARRRVARLRGVMALTGLNAFDLGGSDGGLHGALVTAHDPRSLAAELRIDLDFARRVELAASDLFDLRALADKAQRLPLASPVDSGALSSGFGPRRDPITGFPHFHAGLDFPGADYASIRCTAPGVVVFTGARSGYGYTVEIDHGGGFWTRYAHLNEVEVVPGQRVAEGQRIGGMGSTGHSTGTHLHYEVWHDGRALDPGPFLRAGELIRLAG